MGISDAPTVLQSVSDNASAEEDTRVFDLSGRFLGNDLSGLAKGVYIRGGKLIMLK
ncbi:MAG: hypothetical protein II951_03350 [Bacteroidales bacterium]|nr:hypothetical protein [Bacteroidales bacterium]